MAVGWSRGFNGSAGFLLLLTGLAKVWSTFGSSSYLGVVDPVVGIQFRLLLLVVGVLEILIAGLCLLPRFVNVALTAVAWLATNFLVYRFGLRWIGWHRPCSCLGNLTDALHISPALADNVMKGVLAYLLIGSYGLLFWHWRQSRKMNTKIEDEGVKMEGTA